MLRHLPSALRTGSWDPQGSQPGTGCPLTLSLEPGAKVPSLGPKTSPHHDPAATCGPMPVRRRAPPGISPGLCWGPAGVGLGSPPPRGQWAARESVEGRAERSDKPAKVTVAPAPHPIPVGPQGPAPLLWAPTRVPQPGGPRDSPEQSPPPRAQAEEGCLRKPQPQPGLERAAPQGPRAPPAPPGEPWKEPRAWGLPSVQAPQGTGGP